MSKKPVRVFKGPASSHAGTNESIWEFSDGHMHGGLLSFRTTDDEQRPIRMDIYRTDGQVSIVAAPADIVAGLGDSAKAELLRLLLADLPESQAQDVRRTAADDQAKDRKRLDAALRLVREQIPDATHITVTTSDQNYYGFVLASILTADGEVDPQTWPSGLGSQVDDELCDINWDGVVRESHTGHATIPIGPRQQTHVLIVGDPIDGVEVYAIDGPDDPIIEQEFGNDTWWVVDVLPIVGREAQS